MNVTVPASAIKMFQGDLCGGDAGNYGLDAPFCVPEPGPINLDEYSFFQSLIPAWAKDGEQTTAQVCKGIRDIDDEYRRGERRCESGNQAEKEACEAKRKNARYYRNKCDEDVLYWHEIANDWKTEIWAGIVAVVTGLIALIWNMIKTSWFGKRDPRDTIAEGFKTIDKLRMAKGFRSRLMALLGGVMNMGRRWYGANPSDVQRIRDEAIQTVGEKWPETRSRLQIAHEKLQDFLEGLDEGIHPRKASDIRDSDFRNIIGKTDDLLIEQLADRFLLDQELSEQLLTSYQRTMKVVDERLATIVSGQLLPASGVLPSQEMIDHALEETRRYRAVVEALSAANQSLYEILNVVASASQVDPAKNADWLHTMLASQARLGDILRVIANHTAFLEIMNAKLREGDEGKVLKFLKRYHGLDTAKGLILKVQSINSELAKAIGVMVGVHVDPDEVSIPRELQIPLFIILNAMLNNSIVFSNPKLRNNGAEAKITTVEKDGDLILSVVDNGVGIKNIEAVMAGGKEGRERPDLAAGLGYDLHDASEIARKFGISIEHTPRTSMHLFNAGSEFRIRVRIGRGGGKIPPRPVPSPGSPSSAPKGGGGAAGTMPHMARSSLDNGSSTGSSAAMVPATMRAGAAMTVSNVGIVPTALTSMLGIHGMPATQVPPIFSLGLTPAFK